MLSLAGAFRTMAHRQTCTVVPAATRSMTYDRPPSRRRGSTNKPGPIRELSEIINATVEAQEAIQAGSDGVYDPIIDSVPASATTSKSGSGFPILRGFHAHQFVQPKDFSRAEYTKPRSFKKKPALGPDAPTSRHLDLFHQLGIDPRKECLNSSLLSRFVTKMGKIKSRSETNLTWRNQRRVGKAVRRAKMMGIIPVLSRRPLFDTDDVEA